MDNTPQERAQAAGTQSLADLPIGAKGQIAHVGGEDEGLQTRLLEMGFEEGGDVEVAHEGFLGRDPIAVRIHGMLVALRRREARAITVVPVER